MVENDNSTIRAVAWSEVFPWLKIVRVFRLAISARVLILAALAVIITTTGWWAVGRIFDINTPATDWLEPFAHCPWTAVTEAVPNRPMLPGMTPQWQNESPVPHWQPRDAVRSPWELLSRPAFEGLLRNDSRDFSMSTVASLLLCGLWGVAVWAFFGAAICRIAAVQLAADEQVGCGAAMRYAFRKWPSYFAAPLFPIGGVLLATIPVLVLGWIMKADTGLLLGGVLWPLALAAGLLMTLLLLGVLFGWPLMWATISTEGTDSFDALSRSYAYIFQRPLHYLFYIVVAGFIGWLGWLLVQNFAAGVVWMSYWAAGWGAGAARIETIMGSHEGIGRIGGAGITLIHFWAGCVKLLAVGYLFSYFWTAAAAIYLLLRRDVDATETDEVFLDADQSEQTFGLPKVTTDEAGAPAAEN